MENANDILSRIIEDRPPVAPEGERFHKALMRYFEGARNKVLARMAAWLFFCLTLMSLGLCMLSKAHETRTMLLGLVVLLVGFESSILVKLWYWILDNKISVVKALKETQLMMLRSGGGSDANGASESAQVTLNGIAEIPPSFWERLDPVQMRKWIGWFLVAAAIVIVGIPVGMSASSSGSFCVKAGVRQEDAWHFTSSGRLVAESGLVFSRSPEDAALELTLPYENGTIEAIETDDGQKLAFTQQAPGRYSVEIGASGAAIRAMRVIWTLPVGALESAEQGYRVRLRSLVPVDAYCLKSFIDSNGPYQILDDPLALSAVPFRGTFRSPATDMGSCGAMVEKRGQPPASVETEPQQVK